jgi:transcriptional regulator with XRE-family HTH domain
MEFGIKDWEEKYDCYIVEWRKALGMTQRQLATALGIKSLPTISNWENRKQTPEPYLALAIEALVERKRKLLEVEQASF